MKARGSICMGYSPAVLHSLADERLVELVRDGSETAFEVIVARHRRALVRQCARILGEADAEEAVQETLLKAYAALVRGDQVVRTLDPWLRTIARNTGLNMLRARDSRPTVAGDDAACSQSTLASVEHRQQLQDVLNAVASLPARQREAMVLREFEGRSYEEIGARLGASDGAVRQLLNRARGALRTRVGAFTGFEPVLRWLVGGGGGEGAVRLGTLSGGCAITIKICASALPAALALSSASPAPRRATRPQSAAQVNHERPSSSTSQVTTVVRTAGTGALAVSSTVSLRAAQPRGAASSSRNALPRFVAPAKPGRSAPPPNSGLRPSPAGASSSSGAENLRTQSPSGTPNRSPAPGSQPGPGKFTGAGPTPSGQSAPLSLTEATRHPSPPSRPEINGRSPDSAASPGSGVSHSAATALRP